VNQGEAKGEASRSMRLGFVIEVLKHEEREECAKIADGFAFFGQTPEQTATAIAQAIRRRALPRGARDWQENSPRNEPHGGETEISDRSI
jgi:hypothetical protein